MNIRNRVWSQPVLVVRAMVAVLAPLTCTMAQAAEAPAPVTRGVVGDAFSSSVTSVVKGTTKDVTSGAADATKGSIVDWFKQEAKRAETAQQTSSEPPRADARPAPIYAGLAYEVHAGRAGSYQAVDVDKHAFNTGDEFIVYFRPSLPGRVDVYNTDPAGTTKHIDTSQIPGGELTKLGPYEFVNVKGLETLRLVLAPCSTPTLIAATRGIVRVAEAKTDKAAIPLKACEPSASPAPTKTRGIRRVPVEGATAFAIEPAAAEEVSSGEYLSREVTISLIHR